MSEQPVTTATQTEMYWHYTKPKNPDSKMFLLNLGNVATIGNWYGEVGQYFKAWCPMPKRDKALEKQLFGDK